MTALGFVLPDFPGLTGMGLALIVVFLVVAGLAVWLGRDAKHR